LLTDIVTSDRIKGIDDLVDPRSKHQKVSSTIGSSPHATTRHLKVIQDAAGKRPVQHRRQNVLPPGAVRAYQLQVLLAGNTVLGGQKIVSAQHLVARRIFHREVASKMILVDSIWNQWGLQLVHKSAVSASVKVHDDVDGRWFCMDFLTTLGMEPKQMIFVQKLD